jgi:hypothetical protein
MSSRKLKRQMVRDLGIEKASDIIKRKLKARHDKRNDGGGVIRPDTAKNRTDKNT